MDEPLALRPAVVLAEAIRRGETTSRELVETYLERIERHDPALNAVVTLDAEGARRRADAADAALAQGRALGPLHGVPVTVKDCFETAGIRTTSGSEANDHVPERDAEAVARLVGAGAVVVGKTNLPAKVTGQETANSLFGRTNNPWDASRSPGGSSGGPAAAVAAGLSGLELGSDSGGSIRQPAHCCGVYGHFPTFGLVPQRGHVPQVGVDEVDKVVDLMCVGPLARSAADLAVVLEVLAGPDARSAPGWRLELASPRPASLAEYRVAAWLDDPACPVDAAVAGRLEAVAEALERAGATVDRAARPAFSLAEAEEVAFALWVASSSERNEDAEMATYAAAAAALDPDDESRMAQRLRAEVLTHRDWLRLDTERHRLERAWDAFFSRFDALICPVSPVVALAHDPHPDQVDSVDHRLARTIPVDGAERPYLDQLTWNIVVGAARLPATVAPAGVAPGGLPVGVQIVGPHLGDLTTIDLARRLGDLTGGYRPPPAFGDGGG